MEKINQNPCEFTPEIDFGLCYAGDMAGYLKFDIPFDNYPACDYGRMRGYIDMEVYSFINGIHNKYRSMGFFTAPFLVRCALRGHDGKNFFVSKPKLMTAGLLPPCLDHFSFPEYDRLGMHFKLKGCPCFRLMMRLGEMPEVWRSKIKSVDIYVTRQISAYRYGGGHRCEYSDVLRCINSDLPVHEKFDAGEFVLMYKGSYCKSEFSPIFKKHYNDAGFAKTPVWYVRPNNDLVDMLLSETDFYNIASIEASDIIGRKSYQLVSIHSTLDSLLDYLETLDKSPEDLEEACPSAVRLPSQQPVSDREESRPRAVIPSSFLFHIQLHPFILAFTTGLSPP